MAGEGWNEGPCIRAPAVCPLTCLLQLGSGQASPARGEGTYATMLMVTLGLIRSVRLSKLHRIWQQLADQSGMLAAGFDAPGEPAIDAKHSTSSVYRERQV